MDNTRKPQRRFQFIDNSNVASFGQSSTQVRRHVMQEYMREKRWEARSQVETAAYDHEPPPQQIDPQPQAQSRLKAAAPLASQRRNRHIKRDSVESSSSSTVVDGEQAVPSSLKHVSTDKGDVRAPDTRDGPGNQLACTRMSMKTGRVKQGFHLDALSFAALANDLVWETPSPPPTIVSGSSWSPPPSSCNRTVSPLSVLSAARTDPFDVLPVRLDRQDQELFDFYAVVMPSCSYGFERRHHKAHNWYRDVFIPEAMKGPVTFKNTILVHAANTQAWVRGLKESPLALEYRHKAISALQQHYSAHPDDVSDEVITATMSAAALEDFDPRPERKPYAWIHWTAAMQKIRQAGGAASLDCKPSLRKLVNWQDYISSGYDGRGSTFYFTPEASLRSKDAEQLNVCGRNEVTQQCEELLIFLGCVEHLALAAASQSRNPVARQIQKLRYSAFEPEHPLYILLASPNKARYTETGQLKQIISRLGSLITINIAVWEYRYDTRLSEAFLAELVNNVMYNELNKNISVEALMQILLSGSENATLRHTERPWLVGRLLKVSKRLSRASWERLNDFLLSCLTLDNKFEAQMRGWEGFLRAEILQAPLVSHRLPLMEK